MMYAEAKAKVDEGFVEIVYLDEIENLLGSEAWRQLKISPLVMVPHKSRKFRAIFDLSFGLKLFGMHILSVNDSTIITAPQHSIRQLDSVLPSLIAAVVVAPESGGIWCSRNLTLRMVFGGWLCKMASTSILLMSSLTCKELGVG